AAGPRPGALARRVGAVVPDEHRREGAAHLRERLGPRRPRPGHDVVRDALLHGIAARAPDGATPLRPPGGLLLSAPDRLRARGPSRAGALLHHALAARPQGPQRRG